MRFHLGAIPEGPDFPSEASWRPIREPGPLLMQFCALPLGLIAFVAVGWCWARLVTWSFIPSSAPGMGLLFAALFFLSMPAIIVVHELIHAGVHPEFGKSPATVVGFWPSKLVFYAHYEGELSRNRFLAVFLMPFLVITILPLCIVLVLGLPSGLGTALVAWCSTWNALLACGDLFGAALVAFQVPPRAIVRNHGWRTFWKLPTIQGA
jgi:putative zincin peptidase